MHGIKKLSLGLAAIGAVAAVSLPASAAAAKPVNSVVVPGKSISGIKLGETKKAVHDSEPLELKKPTSSVRSPIPALGATALSETYTTVSSVGRPTTLIVSYLLPKKSKKKSKKKQPKVIFISTGQGFWNTFVPAIGYDSTTGESSNPSQVADAFGCVFYTKYTSGVRNYNDVTASDAQYCELIFSQDTYMYFTFNNGYSAGPGGSNLPAFLHGFSLSRFQIP